MATTNHLGWIFGHSHIKGMKRKKVFGVFPQKYEHNTARRQYIISTLASLPPTPHQDDAVFLGRQLAAFYQMQNYYLEEEQSPPETCLQLEAKINICLSLFSIHQVEGS